MSSLELTMLALEVQIFAAAGSYLCMRAAKQHLIGSKTMVIAHLAGMTRELLERMSGPHANNLPPPWREHHHHWPLRLVGAALLAGGATLAAAAESLSALATWPAWLMLAAGIYIVVRR